ncbi:MAG: hypothetical protein WC969_06310 [Elusimicrobiota bacterium]|jgi:hypothetical protein
MGEELESLRKEDLVSALNSTQQRVRELEDALGRFKDEVRWLEDCLKKRTRELNERVKELDCLFGVARLVEKPGATLDEILSEVVAMLPRAWQYPDAACARVRLRGREHRSPGFQKTSWVQTSEFRVQGRAVCAVDVFYTRVLPKADEGPFLLEERKLLDEVARRVGEIVAIKDAEDDISGFLRQVSRLRSPKPPPSGS